MNPYGYNNGQQQGFQPYTEPARQVQGQQQGFGQQGLGGGQMGGGVPTYSGGPSGFNFPQGSPTAGPQIPGMLPLEQSYVENILRLNRGKLATVYMTFEGTRDNQKRQQVFKGIIEAAGRDHLILSDPQTGMRYLLLMVYLDYVTFDEEIEYEYPFQGGGAGLTSFPPR